MPDGKFLFPCPLPTTSPELCLEEFSDSLPARPTVGPHGAGFFSDGTELLLPLETATSLNPVVQSLATLKELSSISVTSWDSVFFASTTNKTQHNLHKFIQDST